MISSNYSTDYKVATLAHIPAGPNKWGRSTADEIAELRDASAAFDGAGCNMPEGGLSDHDVMMAELRAEGFRV
jgi:hypothetical protein